MYNKTKIMLALLALLNGIMLSAQSLVWTGNAGDNDFFNENNWKYTQDDNIPSQGTLDPGSPIDVDLRVENVSETIGGENGVSANIVFRNGKLIIENAILNMQHGFGIDMGNSANSIEIKSAVLKSDYVNNADMTLGGDAQLYFRSSTPFDANTTINIVSEDAWIYAPKVNAVDFNNSFLTRVKINNETAVDHENVRVVQYYSGTAISYYNDNIAPLRVFDAAGLAGDFADITMNVIHSGSNIPGSMENKISSFKLKKGYMVTLAVEQDGTGLSKVYIASESDLVVSQLPPALTNSLSFIRVVPWIWVNKKGTGGDISNIGASWYYSWGAKHNSYVDREFAPMGWGKGSFDSQSEVNAVLNKKSVTHVMSFNESDHCEGQSGRWGSLCVVDTAVVYHKNTMKTGLRIVSPSNREGKELTWLKDMNNLAVPMGVRMDVIGMHWYDWASNPASTPNANPENVFNRFKSKVIACYNYYKMPIWITEFNANPSRNRWVQNGFLELALPWLEETPYVERYAYFQPNGGNGDFFDGDGNITSTGEIYLNHISTPSIKEEDYNRYVNNIESRLNETYVPEPENNLVKNGFFNDNGSNWKKNNSDIVFELNAETGINGTTCRLPGAQNARSIEQNIAVLPGESYTFSFIGRIQNSVGASGSQPNEHTTNGAATLKGEIITPESAVLFTLSTQSAENEELSGEFTAPDGVSSVTVKLSKDWNIAYLDNVLVELIDLTTVNKTDHNKLNFHSIDNKLYFESLVPIFSLNIFDVTGRLLENRTPMSTNTIVKINTPGVYIAQVVLSDGEKYQKKILVN